MRILTEKSIWKLAKYWSDGIVVQNKNTQVNVISETEYFVQMNITTVHT